MLKFGISILFLIVSSITLAQEDSKFIVKLLDVPEFIFASRSCDTAPKIGVCRDGRVFARLKTPITQNVLVYGQLNVKLLNETTGELIYDEWVNISDTTTTEGEDIFSMGTPLAGKLKVDFEEESNTLDVKFLKKVSFDAVAAIVDGYSGWAGTSEYTVSISVGNGDAQLFRSTVQAVEYISR